MDAKVLTLVLCVASYLFCGIPFGMLIARARGVDVRKVGSGNIGATNVGRSVGAWAAALTFLLDAGKGWLCTGVSWLLLSHVAGMAPGAIGCGGASDWMMACIYASCVLGHVFSPYLGFHGGKGISVGFGAAFGFDPRIAFGLLLVFAVFAVPTRLVSLGSCSAALSLCIWAAAFGYTPLAVAPLAVVACCVLWAHRSNIGKLVRGEEKRFSFHHDDKGGEGR